MNLKLEKILEFNKRSPFLSFGLSILALGLSLFFLIYIFQSHVLIIQKFERYHTHCLESTYLKKADKALKTGSKDAPLFLTENLENLPLLQQLENRFQQNPNAHMPIELNPRENRLCHKVEGALHKGKIHKTTFGLTHPVLIDEEDLKGIISLVESRSIFPFHAVEKSPYLYFKSFKLEKQRLDSYEQVYELTYLLESLSL